MNKLVDSSSMQYAVIAGLRTEIGPERLVIAYPNEESLRDLIAAPSILAVGFSSREDALAAGKASVPIAYGGMPKGLAGMRIETDEKVFHCAALRI